MTRRKSQRKLARQKSQPAKRAQDPLALLEQKIREEGVFPEMKLARTRPGEEKMSAVLLDFLRPYLHYAKTREAFERLIVLAILAWNGAINPESNWEEVIHKGLPGLTLIERQEVKAMVAEMIARKQRYFAGNQRLILSYSVMDTPAGWDVSVASTLGEPERKATS